MEPAIQACLCQLYGSLCDEEPDQQCTNRASLANYAMCLQRQQMQRLRQQQQPQLQDGRVHPEALRARLHACTLAWRRVCRLDVHYSLSLAGAVMGPRGGLPEGGFGLLSRELEQQGVPHGSYLHRLFEQLQGVI